MEIQEKLSHLPHWKATENNTAILREISFLDKKNGQSPFRNGLNFVEQAAELADEMNHHPDILLTYTKVEIRLTTHEKNGLTNIDFKLADAIEFLLSNL
ncbi:4a-hydroxytetrahydrobiopterin dehydratase [Chloroherpeton thalassium]|uniref:4a-hydroxytetrahydrobiopterin dehydratase n=1 Tax=Chloroherpeton thalassium TaxID=100716 RepID=UPI00145EADFF|nr:4a-hydroxytetrahydrobiopterin dehydratase [Chloroherpeton thalassium]